MTEIPEGVIETDRYDRRVFGELLAASEPLQKLRDEATKKLDAAGELLQDSWASLYKVQPRIRDDAPPALSLNREVMERIMDAPEWKDLRAATRLDEHASALGALTLSESLLSAIPENARERANEAARAEREAVSHRETAEAFLELAQAAREMGQGEKAQEFENQAALHTEAAASSGEKAKRLRDLPPKQVKAVRNAVRAAVKGAADAFAAANDGAEAFVAGWGTGAGTPREIVSKEKFEIALALRSNPRLLAIARMAGRMIRIALAKRRTKARQEPTEVVDIEVGSDLARVLPVELSKLSHPVLGKDFRLRFAEGKLLQYRLQAKAPQGRGPIVTCVDTSGSMSGDREIWSKAVALALFQVAAREKRAFALICFSSKTDVMAFEFENPARAHAPDVAKAATVFFGGGTDFETPLTAAMEIMKKSAFQRGDIVFITDGECAVSGGFLAEFRAAKAAKEFSVFSIVMPGGTTESVRPFSDKTFYTEPSNDRETLDILFDEL